MNVSLAPEMHELPHLELRDVKLCLADLDEASFAVQRQSCRTRKEPYRSLQAPGFVGHVPQQFACDSSSMISWIDHQSADDCLTLASISSPKQSTQQHAH